MIPMTLSTQPGDTNIAPSLDLHWPFHRIRGRLGVTVTTARQSTTKEMTRGLVRHL